MVTHGTYLVVVRPFELFQVMVTMIPSTEYIILTAGSTQDHLYLLRIGAMTTTPACHISYPGPIGLLHKSSSAC